MKVRSTVILSFLFVVAISCSFFVYFNMKLHDHKKEIYHNLKICKQIVGSFPYSYRLVENAVHFPPQLSFIPLSYDDIVLNVKKLDIRNVVAPHNASLIEHGDGYLIFFRYDLVKQMHLHLFHSHIDCAELDKNLNQTEKEFITFNTNSTFSEDPRVVKCNGNFSLIYNDLIPARFYSRMMHIGTVDFENQRLVNIQKIDPQKAYVEKNWPPFAYKAQDGSESMHFEYLLFNPRKVFKLHANHYPQWIESKNSEGLNRSCTEWSKTWGNPLGGTSARLVDGKYLSFFHSKFLDPEKNYWYVMGAYTFESKPPFRITAISEKPILFKGIYDSIPLNTARPNKYVIFPGGFAIENKPEKTLIHLGCGENDSAIKILTMDKDALLRSLKKIDLGDK